VRTETFSTPGSVSLEINIPAGDVDIETIDGDETEVELQVRGRDAEELERDARIEVRPRGNRYEVVVAADRGRAQGFFRSRDGDYRVHIKTPHGAAVEANLASADISGHGRYSEIEIHAASGDVQFDAVEGAAGVDTASGDVRLDRVGTAKVNCASGDVRIDEARGQIEVNTASGDVQLRNVVSGKVEVNSASGDLEVAIAKGSRLFVDAQTLSGDTSSELELESGAPIEGDEGPLVELRAVSMSGDISVKRA
jgi:DUF4097 and DUF4098 domain-containing protein YvlB